MALCVMQFAQRSCCRLWLLCPSGPEAHGRLLQIAHDFKSKSSSTSMFMLLCTFHMEYQQLKELNPDKDFVISHDFAD